MHGPECTLESVAPIVAQRTLRAYIYTSVWRQRDMEVDQYTSLTLPMEAALHSSSKQDKRLHKPQCDNLIFQTPARMAPQKKVLIKTISWP